MKRNMILCLFVALVFGVIISGSFGANLPDGLVFLMTFDEGLGDKVNDLSGYGNNGTVEGKEDWVNGKYGKGFNFDGATYITVPNAKPLSDLTHPMSVGLWINPSAVGGWRSILEMDGPTGWKIGLHNGTDAVVWTTYFIQDFVAATPVATDEWSHIAAVWDGSQALIYLDGELDATIAGGGVINVSTVPSLDLGYRSSTSASWYAGVVDEAFVFNRLINQDELKTYMAGFGSLLAVKPGGKLVTAWGDLKYR